MVIRNLLIYASVIMLGACNYNHPLNDGMDVDGEDVSQSRLVEVTVMDYAPMPGQFINTTPPYVSGDNHVSMADKATEYLKNGYFISLGTWGGSVTLKLHEPINHRLSGRDFRIIGNAFYNSGSKLEPRFGASEPGIVMVSQDADGNGQPDCWYEIRGSEYMASVAPYSITYINRGNDVEWLASDGTAGVIHRNRFHDQSYFPQWINSERISFNGRKLPDNGYINPSTGLYTQRCFEFGYADCRPNSSEESIINLAWAIDDEGNSVELPSIDFIKIYTGVFQSSDEFGECSTEIGGVEIPAE